MERSLFSCIHAHLPLQFSAHSLRTGLSYTPQQSLSDNTAFSGRRLTYREQFHPSDSLKTLNYPFSPATAAVQWKKCGSFDAVIDGDKKLQLFLKIRKILLDQPTRTMLLKNLGHHRRELLSTGHRKKRKFLSILRQFPGVIEIINNGAYSPIVKLTEEAEKLYLEEMEITDEMKDCLVIKLRKLLMMSLEKRILLVKIGCLKADLGLPINFSDTICRSYPQYFKVVETEHGLALELTHWDPALAVSAAEIKEGDLRIGDGEMEGKAAIDQSQRFDRFDGRDLDLPRGMGLKREDFQRLHMFRSIPFISPYSDFSGLRFNTLEKEKHSCAVIHEILSLTLEKRTLMDHFTHFRYEFSFPQHFRQMLIRHPEMFYVSKKGIRNCVFLREAYCGSQLMGKDLKISVKEKLRALVSRRVPLRKWSCRNGGLRDDGVEDDSKKKKAVLIPNDQPRECW